jgi:hypothetical protein
MKVRALAAHDRPLPGPLFPFANQVPYKQVPGGAAPRIPERRLKPFPIGPLATEAEFLVNAAASDVGVEGTGVSEIAGFTKVEE